MSAKQKITLASLYIGSSEIELLELIDRQLSQNSNLKVEILIDYFRGTRFDKNGESTFSLLIPLHQKYPERFTLHLYHTPNINKFLKLIVPSRFIEGFGLQHMKLYIFDNSIIVSGANLSKDYFCNRQDRYILLKNHNSICEYFCEIIHIIGKYCYHPNQKNELKNDKTITVPIIEVMLKTHIRQYQKISHRPLHKTNHNLTTYLFPSIQMASFGIIQDQNIIKRFLNHEEHPNR